MITFFSKNRVTVVFFCLIGTMFSLHSGIDIYSQKVVLVARNVGLPLEEPRSPFNQGSFSQQEAQQISRDTSPEESLSPSNNQTPSDSESELLKSVVRGCLKKGSGSHARSLRKVAFDDEVEIHDIEDRVTLALWAAEDQAIQRKMYHGGMALSPQSFYGNNQMQYLERINYFIVSANQKIDEQKSFEPAQDLRDMLRDLCDASDQGFEKKVLQEALVHIGKAESRFYSSRGGESSKFFIEAVSLCAVTQPPAPEEFLLDDVPVKRNSLMGGDTFEELYSAAIKTKDKATLEALKEVLDPDSEECLEVEALLREMTVA